MRKFAFVVFGIDNTIIDRTPLDLVTDLGGLGWKLKLTTISGDVVSVITKVVQEKQSVSLTLNFLGRGYEKYAILSQWLQKYARAENHLALEYDDGVSKRYVEGRVTALGRTEKDEYQNLVAPLTFTPLTPFFRVIENSIKIQVSAIGKCYPFKYPYSYGKNKLENNEIDNPYLADIPVTVTIYGAISNPTVSLLYLDSDYNWTVYNTVKFPDLDLTEGQHILINSAQRKIWYFDGASLLDYSAHTDPSLDSFLMAQNGVSRISVNLETLDSGRLEGNWRQYTL
ncbi:MAG: hypothetical protein IJX91_04625 [Clostridia bacterium]|nr:hypothetical protein [Clostridia bacterium]